jgi:hypothetical protein
MGIGLGGGGQWRVGGEGDKPGRGVVSLETAQTFTKPPIPNYPAPPTPNHPLTLIKKKLLNFRNRCSRYK